MRIGVILVAFAFLSFLSRPAVAQNIVVPQNWAGIWDYTETENTCGLTDYNTYTFTDTLCAGPADWDAFTEEFGEDFDVECSGQFGETAADVICTLSGTNEGLEFTFVTEMHLTRSGESYTGTQMQTTVYSGPGCELIPGGCEPLNSCLEFIVQAVRTGPEPPSCVTPVRNVTWSTIKSLYK